MKFKKTAVTFLMSTVLMASFATGTSAAPTKAKNYTEKELNQILIKAGVPMDVLSKMDFENKRFIVKNSGVNLKFSASKLSEFDQGSDGSLAEINTNSDGGITPNVTIPTSDMDLWTYVFYNSSDSSMYDVYASFEWHKLYDIDNDHIGVAVPEQWVIQSGSYSSETYYQTINSHNYNSWYYWDASGGRPYQIDLYGADWCYDTPIGINGEDPGYMYWKGTVKYTMKSSGSAQNRVVSKYASVNGGWGSAAIDVGIGPASISYSPPDGWFSGIDQASDDATW